MEIKKATISDADKLSGLSIKFKSYWNHGEEQIEIWKSDLSTTKAYILNNEVYKLIEEEKRVAYYAYFGLDKEKDI